MQVASGTVIDGKVVVEGLSLPEGTVVTVLARGMKRLYSYRRKKNRTSSKPSTRLIGKKAFQPKNCSHGFAVSADFGSHRSNQAPRTAGNRTSCRMVDREPARRTRSCSAGS